MPRKIKVMCIVVFVCLLYSCIIGVIFRSVSRVPASSQSVQEEIKLPIVMYHSVLKDENRSGAYTVMPYEIENDIKFLQKRGYEFVSADDLINYVDYGYPLPEKCAMLTFDDGFYNIYGYVLPILEKYGAKAVVSVVGSYTDEASENGVANLNYSYLRWSDIYDLILDPHMEVGSHSYDFHSIEGDRNGAKKMKGESSEEYEKIFRADTEKLQNRFLEETGFTPIIYAYPFGAYSSESTEVLKGLGFRVSFTCSEGVNTITRDSDSLFLLDRYNRPSGIGSYDFFAKIIGE